MREPTHGYRISGPQAARRPPRPPTPDRTVDRPPRIAPIPRVAVPAEVAVDLSLLEGFELRLDGEPVDLPLGAQRLVAFLALRRRPLQRSFVAGSLWLDSSDDRAAANLRSALWRLHQHGRQLVETQGGRISLAPDVRVDVHAFTDQARQVLDREAETPAATPNLYELSLTGDLLPDWYEDWILVERERFRQLRLHALESLCDSLTAQGRYANAIDAGLAAVSAEPLRETAHRALIRCYLAEGNQAEALRQYRRYERVLADELGARPSAQMRTLMDGVSFEKAS